MEKRPLVSVKMLAYNHGEFIGEAIESVLMQKVDFEYEIVIGEDCSTDNTRDIILDYQIKYPDIIKPILRDENIGATYNSYDAAMKCKGEYIAVLEGDNFWTDSNKLSKQVQFLRENSNYALVASRYYVVNKDSEVISHSNNKDLIDKRIGKKEFLKYGAGLAHPTTMVYRNIFYNSDKDYKIITTYNKFGSHLITLAMLANEGSIYIMPSYMGAWRLIEEKEGTNFAAIAKKNPIVTTENHFVALKNLQDYFGSDYNFSFMIARDYVSSVIRLIRNENTDTYNDIKKITKYLSFKELMISIPYFIIIPARMVYNKIKRTFYRNDRSNIKNAKSKY